VARKRTIASESSGRRTSPLTAESYHHALTLVTDKARQLNLVSVSEAHFQEWTLEIEDVHTVRLVRINEPGVDEAYQLDIEYDLGLTEPKKIKDFVQTIENRAYLTADELLALYKRLKTDGGIRFSDRQSTPVEIALFYQAVVHAGSARVSFNGVTSIGVKRLSRYLNENPVMMLSQDEFVNQILAAQNATYIRKDVSLNNLGNSR
jgi:hypothetical protein